jgi:hypothetical protein
VGAAKHDAANRKSDRLPERIGTIIGQALTAFIYAVVVYLVLTNIRFLICLSKGGHGVGRAEEYRKKAAEFRTQAELVRTNELARRMQEYAAIYLRLADMAERNEDADLVYEPPPPKLNENG